MKRLFFMRHGLSEANQQGLISGHTDTPLTEQGREEARKAGRAAKDLGIDLIVASPLMRAHETAKEVARELGYPEDKIIVNPLLVERNFGSLEGAIYGAPHDFAAATGYEHDELLIKRAQQALDWINTLKADDILVVSHGAFGRAMRSILKADQPLNHWDPISNAEIICWVEGN